jgi:hypothetical protein
MTLLARTLYTSVERDLLKRLGERRPVHVAVAERAEVLASLARRGYCTIRPGAGKDAGIVIGLVTPAGLAAAKIVKAGPVE